MEEVFDDSVDSVVDNFRVTDATFNLEHFL